MSTTPEKTSIEQEAFDAIHEEAEKSPLVFTYKFPTPFKWEGKTYTELTFDFGACKGKDMLAVANDMRALNHPIVVKALDEEYCLRLAARVCTTPIGFDVYLEMPGKAYDAIVGAARSFLLRSEDQTEA